MAELLSYPERERAADAIDAWPGLTPSAKRVGVYLLRRYNVESGLCCPSFGAIAAGLGLDAGTVQRAVKALEAAGLFAVRRGWGRGRPSHYMPARRLLLEGWERHVRAQRHAERATKGGENDPLFGAAEDAAERGAESPPFSGDCGNLPAKRGANGRKKGDRMPPQTLKESELEPEGDRAMPACAMAAVSPGPAGGGARPQPPKGSARDARQLRLRVFGEIAGGERPEEGQEPKSTTTTPASLSAEELRDCVVAALRRWFKPERRAEIAALLTVQDLAELGRRMDRLPARGIARLLAARGYLDAVAASPLRAAGNG